VTTATGVPIHDPTFAVASTEPVAALRAVSAIAAVGEEVCVRSPPAKSVETSVASPAGAPVTRTPVAGEPEPDVLPSDEEAGPDDAPGLPGAPDEHPASATAVTVTAEPMPITTDLRARAGRPVTAGLTGRSTGSAP